MNPAACSWRVRTSSIDEVRNASTRSRFSSPGTAKFRSTPSCASAAAISSAAFIRASRAGEADAPAGVWKAAAEVSAQVVEVVEVVGLVELEAERPGTVVRQPCRGDARRFVTAEFRAGRPGRRA